MIFKKNKEDILNKKIKEVYNVSLNTYLDLKNYCMALVREKLELEVQLEEEKFKHALYKQKYLNAVKKINELEHQLEIN